MMVDAVRVDDVRTEVVKQAAELAARFAGVEEARQRLEARKAGGRREFSGKVAPPFRGLVVGMVHGEFGAGPAALAKQREVVEMHALGAALAIVQAMDSEKSHGIPSFRLLAAATRPPSCAN